MNNTDGALDFKAYIDNTWLYRTAAETEARIKGITTTVERESKQMTSSFSSVEKGLAVIGGTTALMFLGKQIIDTTAKFEKFGIVLRNTLGDTKGNEALDMIAKFAATTPFQLDEVTDSFIRMANQGFVPTRNEMVKLGDLASSTGKGFNMLTEAILDAQTGQFERLKEFGIKASSNGDKVTFSFREQQTTVDKTNSAIRDYILSLGELNGIQGANALISKSMTGQISNLSDKFDAMFNQIGQANSGIIYSGLEIASELVENYETVGKVVLGLVGVYGAYKTAVLVTNAVDMLRTEIAYQQILANIGNTGSTITLTTAEGVAAVAKSKLTAAQLALNASILANPYVAAVAAVVALSAAVYFLATRTTDAEKAQNELNKSLQSETLTLDIMFSRLKNATKGTDEYRLAKQAIIEKYGQYDAMLSTELDSVGGLKTAYDKLTKSVIEATKSRLRDKYVTEAANDAGEDIAKQYGAIRDRLIDVLGNEAGGALFESVKAAFENGGDWEKVLKDSGIDPRKMYGVLGQNLNFRFDKIAKEKKELADSLKEYDQIFGSSITKTEEGSKRIEAAIIKNREFWEKQREVAKKVLESMPNADKGNEKWNEQVKLIKEAEAALDAYNLKSTAKDDKKDKDEAERLRKEYEDAEMEAKRKAAAEDLALKRSLIKDKKELIDFDLKQELQAIADMQKLYEEKAAKAGVKNPDISMFGSMKTIAETSATNSKAAIDKELYNDLLEQYRSYEERKSAITAEYDKKRAVASASGNKELIDRLNKAEQQDIAKVTIEELMNSPQWAELFDNLDTMTVGKMIELRNNLEAKWAKLDLPPDQLKALRDQIDEVNDKILSKNPFAALADSIKRFGGAADDASKSEAFVDMFKSAAASAETLNTSMQQVLGTLNNLGVEGTEDLALIANQIVGIAQDASSLAMGIATGNPVAIVQGAVGVVTKGIDMIAGAHDRKLDKSLKQHKATVDALVRTYEALERSIDKALGDARYSGQKAIIDNLKAQQQQYAQMAADEDAKKDSDHGKIDEYNAQINQINVQIAEMVKGIREDLLGGTAKDLANDLGNAMFEAFAKGESAAEAWGKKVNAIVGDIVKRMLIQKLVEEPVGAIINKYTAKWVDENGNFAGFDKVMTSADAMGKDLNKLAPQVEAQLNSLPESIKKYLTGDSTAAIDDKKGSLSGAIQTVTEETAGVVSGQINAMRIIQVESQTIMKQQLVNLAEIASNTRYLKSIDTKLSSLSSSDTLRSQGL